MSEIKIIIPEIFRRFPEIKCGISTNCNDNNKFGFNLSYTVGDDPANVKNNRTLFFNALDIDESKVCYQKQIHSVNHNYVSSPDLFKNSDALFTDKADLYLAISIADCIPVLLYEPEKKVIAGIHSGWKGTRDKIVMHTINTIKEKFNINNENLIAYIGPGISSENFEVGEDVWNMFDQNYRISKNNKYYIDLKKNILDNLIQLGVNKNNIEVSQMCTYNNNELHSYRRDGCNSGRMLCVIGRTN